MKLINKISDYLNMIMRFVSCIFMFTIVVSCFLQVVSRYIFNNSISWTEELARASFVWASMLGLTIATKKWTNPTIDVLSGMLKGNAKRIHKALCEIGIIALCVVLGYWGVFILPAMGRTITAAMRLPLSYIYFSIPLSAGVIIVHCINDIVIIINEMKKTNNKIEKGGEF